VVSASMGKADPSAVVHATVADEASRRQNAVLGY